MRRGCRGGSRDRASRLERSERRKRGREAAADDDERGCEAAAGDGGSVGLHTQDAASPVEHREPAGLDDLLAADDDELEASFGGDASSSDAASAERGRKAAADAARAQPSDAAIAARFISHSRPCYLCKARFLTSYAGTFPLCPRCMRVAATVGAAPPCGAAERPPQARL